MSKKKGLEKDSETRSPQKEQSKLQIQSERKSLSPLQKSPYIGQERGAGAKKLIQRAGIQGKASVLWGEIRSGGRPVLQEKLSRALDAKNRKD